MIVYLSFNDWCATAYHYCQAYKLYDSAKHVVYHNTKRHPKELCVAIHGTYKVQEVVDKASLLHFIGDEPITIPWKWKYSNATINLPDVPKILTVIGSYFRETSDKDISCPIYTHEELLRHTTARTFVTPDLEYDWFKSFYIPLAYNVSATNNVWTKPTDKIKIGHSPTIRTKKGTDIIIRAIELLDNKNIELDIIENVTWEECLDRKKQCHLFIEDMKCGIWGYSAIEAMAYGIPTISYINPSFIEKYEYLHNHPIINSKPDHIELSQVIKNTLDLDLSEISNNSRKFVQDVHSYEKIGSKLHRMYKMYI